MSCRVAVEGVEGGLAEDAEGVFGGEDFSVLFAGLCYLSLEGGLGGGVCHVWTTGLSVFEDLRHSGSGVVGVLGPELEY